MNTQPFREPIPQTSLSEPAHNPPLPREKMELLTLGETEELLKGETPRASEILDELDIPAEMMDGGIKEQIRSIVDLLLEGGEFFDNVVAMQEENQIRRLDQTMKNMERRMAKYEMKFKQMAEKNKKLLNLRNKLKSYV